MCPVPFGRVRRVVRYRFRVSLSTVFSIAHMDREHVDVSHDEMGFSIQVLSRLGRHLRRQETSMSSEESVV
jgi:hypothetical protein